MPEDKTTQDAAEDTQEEFDPQAAALAELDAIMKASPASLKAQPDIDNLLTDDPPDVGEPKGSDKPAKSASKSSKSKGVRYNNLEEAEAETRKLQSDRDTLQAKLDTLEAQAKELEHARLLLSDINNDPKLRAGLEHYYKDGSFVEPAKVASDGIGDYDDDFGGGAETVPQSGDIDTLVEQKVQEQLRAVQVESARKQWYVDQKTAFHEAHPNASDEDFKAVVEFMQEPKNVTFTNIYELLNQRELIEERAKQLAEQMFRGRGSAPRPSIGSMSGVVPDVEGDPETDTVKAILRAGKRESLLG